MLKLVISQHTDIAPSQLRLYPPHALAHGRGAEPLAEELTLREAGVLAGAALSVAVDRSAKATYSVGGLADGVRGAAGASARAGGEPVAEQGFEGSVLLGGAISAPAPAHPRAR